MRLGWPHFRILVLNVLWVGTTAAKMHADDHFHSFTTNDTTHTITYIEELG